MASNANVDTIVQVRPAENGYTFDEGRVIDIVRQKLLSSADVEYSHANVRVRYANPETPRYLVVTVLHRDSYTANMYRIVLDNDLNALSINPDCMEMDEQVEVDEDEIRRKIDSVNDLAMVFATPRDDYQGAVESVQYACEIANRLGYPALTLIGPEATVSAYEYSLTKKLKAFASIGHGLTPVYGDWCYGIVCADYKPLYTYWFGMAFMEFLDPEVIYLNSCMGFLPPLATAIEENGRPRTYISGKVNLNRETSEHCFRLFWQTVLDRLRAVPMGTALADAEKEAGISGQMGIFGDSGPL